MSVDWHSYLFSKGELQGIYLRAVSPAAGVDQATDAGFDVTFVAAIRQCAIWIRFRVAMQLERD